MAPLKEIWLCLKAGACPLMQAIWKNPALLLRPSEISRMFMANVWIAFAEGINENSASVKRALITENAYGIVLDLGAGHGHTVDYLTHSRVTKYIALEPNLLMHPKIRAKANAAGYTELNGNLSILGCGAEEINLINSSLGGPNQVDTVVSVLSLCSIPEPEKTLNNLAVHVIKPHGGQLLFYEHVLSDSPDVAWWQRFWTPIWSLVMDGCRLDVPSHLMVKRAIPDWKEQEIRLKDGEDQEHIWVHRIGRFVRS